MVRSCPAWTVADVIGSIFRLCRGRTPCWHGIMFVTIVQEISLRINGAQALYKIRKCGPPSILAHIKTIYTCINFQYLHNLDCRENQVGSSFPSLFPSVHA